MMLMIIFCIHCARTMCYASHGRMIHLYSRLMRLTEELAQSFQSWETGRRDHSKKLLPAERNYIASELECLAIVRAADHFAVHLLKPNHFTPVTDHCALKVLKTSNKLNGRLMRWAMALQPYNFNVEYRKGAQNGNADGLSRQAWEEPQPTDNDQRHQPSEGGVLGTNA